MLEEEISNIITYVIISNFFLAFYWQSTYIAFGQLLFIIDTGKSVLSGSVVPHSWLM